MTVDPQSRFRVHPDVVSGLCTDPATPRAGDSGAGDSGAGDSGADKWGDCDGLWRREPPEEDTMGTSLTRPREDKIVAGVCAGLAERFGWSANTVRLLFLLSCLLPGPQFVIYLVLWVIMPKRAY